MAYFIFIRPAQFFLGFPPQTPRWSLGQILPWNQFSAKSEVVWPRYGGSEGPQVGLILTKFWPSEATWRGQATSELAENWCPGRIWPKLHRGVWGGNPKKNWAGLLPMIWFSFLFICQIANGDLVTIRTNNCRNIWKNELFKNCVFLLQDHPG